MLEKQVSFTIVKDCVEDREMQSLTFSFVSITSSKLITVSCISMVLSLVKITGQLLRKFGRCCQSKNSFVEACNQHFSKSFLTLSNISRKSQFNNRKAIHGWRTHTLSKTFSHCEIIQTSSTNKKDSNDYSPIAKKQNQSEARDRDRNFQINGSHEEIFFVYEHIFRTNIRSLVRSNQRDKILLLPLRSAL